MAGTGFYDKSQGIYLPKDTTTWADLTSGWDGYTSWYSNLSSSSRVSFTGAIIDAGKSVTVVPRVTIRTGLDGAVRTPITLDSSNEDIPKITIEGSDNSDMSSASTVVLTRTSSPTFASFGAKRYYRVTVEINSGTNAQPQGLVGVSVNLTSRAIEEVLSSVNTATYDDGSSVTRTIPTSRTYSAITYVGATPTTTITDTVVSGSSAESKYIEDDYTAVEYFEETAGGITTSNITTVPLLQLASTSTNTFTVRVIKPNTAGEVDCTYDFLVKGLETASINATTGDLL